MTQHIADVRQCRLVGLAEGTDENLLHVARSFSSRCYDLFLERFSQIGGYVAHEAKPLMTCFVAFGFTPVTAAMLSSNMMKENTTKHPARFARQYVIDVTETGKQKALVAPSRDLHTFVQRCHHDRLAADDGQIDPVDGCVILYHGTSDCVAKKICDEGKFPPGFAVTRSKTLAMAMCETRCTSNPVIVVFVVPTGALETDVNFATNHEHYVPCLQMCQLFVDTFFGLIILQK